MKNSVKDDEKRLLQNEELDPAYHHDVSHRRNFLRTLTLTDQITAAFDLGVDNQNPNEYYTSRTHYGLKQGAANKCTEVRPECVDGKSQLEISAISGVTVEYVDANGVNGRCHGPSLKTLSAHLPSDTKKKQTQTKRKRRVSVNERSLARSDYSRAFYSAIYIDTNLTTPHFGDV